MENRLWWIFLGILLIYGPPLSAHEQVLSYLNISSGKVLCEKFNNLNEDIHNLEEHRDQSYQLLLFLNTVQKDKNFPMLCLDNLSPIRLQYQQEVKYNRSSQQPTRWNVEYGHQLSLGGPQNSLSPSIVVHPSEHKVQLSSQISFLDRPSPNVRDMPLPMTLQWVRLTERNLPQLGWISFTDNNKSRSLLYCWGFKQPPIYNLKIIKKDQKRFLTFKWQSSYCSGLGYNFSVQLFSPKIQSQLASGIIPHSLALNQEEQQIELSGLFSDIEKTQIIIYYVEEILLFDKIYFSNVFSIEYTEGFIPDVRL